MFGVGWAELLILSVLGLGCIGVVAATIFVAVSAGRRSGAAPHPEVAPCPKCGAIRPAADRYCGACGAAMH